MRAILKGAEPVSLQHHRAQAHCNYDNYQQKDELRTALVREQRGLCCYCMSRIKLDAMKIEHWRSQSGHDDLQLSYANLLGACRGGHGQPAAHQHCDTRKADRDVRFNPADPAHAIEARIKYRFTGEITSTDPEFDEQLDTVLGLNLPFLRNNRKAVLDAILEWWRSTPPAKRNLHREIDRRTLGELELTPFSPVAVWFLRQKLAGAAA